MLKAEEKCIEFLKQHCIVLFVAAVTVLAGIARYQGRGFVSADMREYNLMWYADIKARGGLAALKQSVGTYNIAYQTYLALISYIDWKPMYMIKLFSILFDYLLAVTIGLIVRAALRNKKGQDTFAAIAYAMVLFLPTVWLNSSLWGQCDAVYSFFVIMTLYLMFTDRFRSAFICWGLALAFKLQAVFIFPFILIYYVIEKKFSVLKLLWTAVAFYVICVPAFFCGCPILAPLQIYGSQKGYWLNMFNNFPSFWVIFGGSQDIYKYLSNISILFTIAVLGIGFLYLLQRKFPLSDARVFFPVAAWCVWTCVLFLPELHDRYAFVLEILMIVLVILNRKYLWAAAPVWFISLFPYAWYLFAREYDLRLLAVAYCSAYCVYIGILLRQLNSLSPKEPSSEVPIPKVE